MIKYFAPYAIIFLFSACSNTPELETGEIKTLKWFSEALDQSHNSNLFIDAKTLLTRSQIDSADIPVLYVELESGQNGTLTPYPGQGIGQTWLGADGATITLEKGVLKASRGMGNDVMGATSTMPLWKKLNSGVETYSRTVKYLNGNNKIFTKNFKCKIHEVTEGEIIKIWSLDFDVSRYQEICNNNGFVTKNTYYVDDREIVRRSKQYHSDTIGYIITERLDR